jgi:hypothetical protein
LTLAEVWDLDNPFEVVLKTVTEMAADFGGAPRGVSGHFGTFVRQQNGGIAGVYPNV